MDKFTVDLDQVLNDFEYSELTEQYNITKAPAEPSHTVTPSSHITKHSINNVFHSLNEYLNTNIKVNLEPVDNTINVNVDAFSDIPNTSDDKKSIDASKTDQDSYSSSEPLASENKDGVNSCDADNRNTVLDSVEKLEILEEDSSNLDHSFVEIKESSVDILTSGENELCFEESNNILVPEESRDDKIDTVFKGESDSKHDIEIDSSKHEIIQSDNVDKIVFDKMPLEVTEINTNESDNEYEDCDNIKEFDKDEEQIISLQEELKEFEKQREEQIISLQEELLEATSEGRGELDNGKQEMNDMVVKTEINTLVGFQDDMHLDDHEINKLLSELEEDDDLNFEMPESQVVAVSKNEECENSFDTNVPESVNVNTNDIPEDSNITQPDIDVHLEIIKDEENISNPNIHVQDPLPDSSNLDASIVDNKILDSATFQVLNLPTPDNKQLNVDNTYIKDNNESLNKETCSEKEIEKPQSEQTVEEPKAVSDLNVPINLHRELENSKCSDVATEEIKNEDLEKDLHQESRQRPQDLPLSSEMIEANRKINLIGGPGHTPYNNIYINSEINKQETSDLDSSSSSSASFSDASSTASTASTEDIQDKTDVANLEDTKIQIPDPVPVDSHLNSTAGAAAANPFDRPETSSNPEISLNNSEEMEQAFAATERNVAPVQENATNAERSWLGKEAPLWIPDSEAMSCLHCDMKFTVLKRRHHCRACGLVLCSKCCHLRFRLEYLDAEARVCNKCHDILNKESSSSTSSGSDLSPEMGNSPSNHRPNPNNPAEYCSTVSPLQQAGQQAPVPSVMVPVGVLKRKGSSKAKTNKSVMFCDGIRPGSDLTHLDNDFNYNNTVTKKLEKNNISAVKLNRNLPLIDSETNTFIPKNENSLPPTVLVNKADVKYAECSNNINIVNTLKIQQLSFAIHISLYVHVRIIDMNCCMKKQAWCFSTEGLINVGQDEIVYLLEYIEDTCVPKDMFYHINNIYNEAVKGNAIKELGLSLHSSPNFLDSKNHAGFVYVRPSFQCLENVIKPKDPYLVGILIHRWETPWAKLFPLRLVLRLGAEYRYYPCPIISTMHRDSVYVEIGHTIINILADFRNFSYTLPQIRGLIIHMEDKNTTVSIPVNRYDQVIKSLNNSSDHILAFAGNFSVQADSHLVCIQDTQGNENCYSTRAINIQNKPRKIAGASFIVFNGALKSSSGLTAKSNIIEDGLMIQVLPEHLEQIRDSLRAMKNHTIPCGCIDNVSDETVQIIWSENDTNFNMGIVSTIDNMSLSGVPSIRVHNGKNYICHSGSRIIRWTEVFIIQNGEENPKNQDPIDVSRVSENIAKATCDALVKYIDLLIANNFQKIGIRTVLQVDNVSYCAGSNGTKLPPIYMKSLDNELIPVLHRITSNNLGEIPVILELIFRILNV